MTQFPMTMKFLFTVCIAAFLVQENGALETDFVKTYESYHKKIDKFLEQALKLVDKVDQDFYSALSAAKTELKTLQGDVSDGQTIILDNLGIQEQTAKLCSHQLLYFLKNNTKEYISSLEVAMPEIAQDLEDDIKKRAEDAGGNVEKVKSCEQKYETELKKTMDWVLAGQVGCIMDQVDDGELLVEEILKISNQITKLLTSFSKINPDDSESDIKFLMEQIEELSETFSVIEANSVMDSKSEQSTKFHNCSALKISQFFITTFATIDKIVDCTKSV